MSDGMHSLAMNPIYPGSTDAAGQRATLGVLGGGQLGRMFVHAAQRLGYFTAVLEPDAQSPAGLVSHHHIQTAYDDPAGLAQLAQLCQAITTEFENVPAQALQTLALTRPVAPGAAVVGIAQDRIEEKAHFTAGADLSGVACAPYAVIETPAQLQAIQNDRADLLPGILKTARLGYDGKGQVRVKTAAELAAAWAELGSVACVLEKMLPLTAECSVLVARGWDGQAVSYAPQRNVHVEGILAVTHAYEGNMPPALATRARNAAVSLAHHLGYVGVLCVEFFVVEGDNEHGELVVNEMAPRPHNSGHYTLDACDVSQFDLQVHTLAGLPLPTAAPAFPGHHAQPAGGGVVRRQRSAARAGLARCAESAGYAPASVRQGRSAPRPQDGPPDHHRPGCRQCENRGAPRRRAARPAGAG